MPTIAIDLGTVHTRAAVWYNGKVQVIKNELGSRTTPSFVAFTATERLIGEAAKNQVVMNCKNTVYDIKRLMGRRYADLHVQNDIGRWPFKICENLNHYPLVELKFQGNPKLFPPEEILAMVLSKMKASAENVLKETVTDAVITVPAIFSSAQRQATKDAGKIAGLNVVRLVSETTAAALAYGFENKIAGKQTIFIYHLGGGAFDVSIIEITDGCNFKVLAVGGDSCLGGIDFDNRLVAHFADEFERNNAVSIRENCRAMCRLRTACENLKKVLSTNTEAFIEIDDLIEDKHLYSKITRKHFEDLCNDLLKKTFKTMTQVFENANFTPNLVDEVFLIGGSTRMPVILKDFELFFGRDKMNFTINAEEIVVCGAALLSAMVTEVHCSHLQQISLSDVAPLPFFVSLDNGPPLRLFKKHIRLPYTFTYETETTTDETHAHIEISEGQGRSQQFRENYYISEISAAVSGVVKMHYNFKLDMDGILKLGADIVSHPHLDKVRVALWSERISTGDMVHMIKNAEAFVKIDRANQQRKVARLHLEEFLLTCEKTLSDSDHLTKTEKDTMKVQCAAELEWLDCNRNGEAVIFENRLIDLSARFDEIRRINRTRREHISKMEQWLSICAQSIFITKKQIVMMKKIREKELKWLNFDHKVEAIAYEKRLNNLNLRFHAVLDSSNLGRSTRITKRFKLLAKKATFSYRN